MAVFGCMSALLERLFSLCFGLCCSVRTTVFSFVTGDDAHKETRNEKEEVVEEEEVEGAAFFGLGFIFIYRLEKMSRPKAVVKRHSNQSDTTSTFSQVLESGSGGK